MQHGKGSETQKQSGTRTVGEKDEDKIQRSNRAEHRRSKQLVSQTTHGSQVTDLPGANEQVTNPSPCLRNKKGKKGNSSIKDNWLTAPLRKQLV